MVKLKDARWYICLDDDSREKAVNQLDAIMPFNITFTDTVSDSFTVVVGSSETCSEIKKASDNGIISLGGFGKDDHIVKSTEINGKKCILIAGANQKAAIYGIFSFLERLGFYFLASGTIAPEMAADIHIPEINKEFKTNSNWRGMFVSFCMVSTSIMSVSDFSELFDSMLRMKLNRIVFYSFENEPIVDYIYKGERKIVGDISRPESGYFSYGSNWTGSFKVDEINIGREKFAHRKRVAPMEFQDVSSSDMALDTGKAFMNKIIDEAAKRNIGVWIAFLPQFVSMNMSKFTKPMPRKNLHWSALVSCTDPAVRDINTARIRNLIDSYPAMEGLFIGIPEGFYEDPYNESQGYIEGQMGGFSEALRLQKKFWGGHWPGDELQKKHIEADIAFSKIAADALEIARMEKPGLKLGLITVCKAYLLTKLHEILPPDVAFCDIESRSLWTHDGAPLFLFRKMKGRECSIIPRITDDGSQAGMQFNLNLYFKDGYCRSVLENGTSGMMMQTLYIKGADHNIKYLADGLWNPLITPDWFYSSYIEKVYGKKSIRKLKKAYDVLEDNEIFMGGRGAANMPWNHVPPEIAVLRSLQNSKDPYNECPLEYDFIRNSENRAAVYIKTGVTLDKIADIFADARPTCNSYGKEESLYMERRTRAYSWHLKALIQLSALYRLYKEEFEKDDNQRELADILAKAESAHFAAKESAILFSKCVVHTTDLAPLWMINSSMVKGTEILLQFINNLISYHKGLGNLKPVRWNQLFGECPYPARDISIRPESDAPHAYEPG